MNLKKSSAKIEVEIYHSECGVYYANQCPMIELEFFTGHPLNCNLYGCLKDDMKDGVWVGVRTDKCIEDFHE